MVKAHFLSKNFILKFVLPHLFDLLCVSTDSAINRPGIEDLGCSEYAEMKALAQKRNVWRAASNRSKEWWQQRKYYILDCLSFKAFLEQSSWLCMMSEALVFTSTVPYILSEILDLPILSLPCSSRCLSSCVCLFLNIVNIFFCVCLYHLSLIS